MNEKIIEQVKLWLTDNIDMNSDIVFGTLENGDDIDSEMALSALENI
jgi:hypothetical protein